MYVPESYEIYPIYKCKKCGVTHMVREREVSWPGGLLCYCGEKIVFSPLKIHISSEIQNSPAQRTEKTQKILSRWEEKKSDSQPKPKTPAPQDSGKQEIYEELVGGLVKLGFKRKDAERRATLSMNKCGPAPIEKLLQEAFS